MPEPKMYTITGGSFRVPSGTTGGQYSTVGA